MKKKEEENMKEIGSKEMETVEKEGNRNVCRKLI